jgi:dihydrofolate synthase/folylpolyglutamate synthase
MDLAGLTLLEPRLGTVRVPLLGRHQAHNVGVALGVVAALEAAGVAVVGDEAAIRGLAEVRWPGRLERVEWSGLTVLLDGAHNPDGATALADALDELAPLLPRGRATLVLGMMADKAVADIVSALAGCSLLRDAQCVTAAVPDTDRSLAADELAAAWAEGTGCAAAAALPDADDALDLALRLAASAAGPLVVTGSLYLVGHVRTRLLGDDGGGLR